jgi:hypothetical protein
MNGYCGRKTLKNNRIRIIALVVSGALFMNCGGGGVVAAVGVLAALAQGEYYPLPMFTDAPGPVWRGTNPGRFERTRGGFYTERALVAIESAARKWRGGGEEDADSALFPAFIGIVTGDSPIAMALTGPAGGGGAGIPGEGKMGNGLGGGVVNTYNGNLMKPFDLVSWPSVGELDFSLSVYHNSLSDYNLELGPTALVNL